MASAADRAGEWPPARASRRAAPEAVVWRRGWIIFWGQSSTVGRWVVILLQTMARNPKKSVKSDKIC
jgi:hypothetical protein